MSHYLWNVLVGIDQLVNAILGGDPDETISSRCAKNQHKPTWRALGAMLEFVDPGHLLRYRDDDEGGAAIYVEKESQR